MLKMTGSESKYPHFEELTEMLGVIINEDGAFMDTAEDLKEARNKLRDAKKLHFEKELLVNIIKDILLEKSGKVDDESRSIEDKQAYSLLATSVRTAEANHLMSMSWSDEGPHSCNVFGLTDEMLNSKHKRKQQVKHTIQQYFIPDIEQRLKQKCMELIRLWDSNTETESDGLALAKAGSLPNFVDNELTKMTEEETKIRKEKELHDDLLLQYKKVLEECMESFEKIAKMRILDSRTESTKTTADWLGAKCEAMQLKIKVLQSQLLKDTYNQDTIPALKQIRDSLNVALRDSKKELVRLEQNLEVYDSIGSGFDSLVKEYAKLTAEIDNRKWALSELKRTQQSGDR